MRSIFALRSCTSIRNNSNNNNNNTFFITTIGRRISHGHCSNAIRLLKRDNSSTTATASTNNASVVNNNNAATIPTTRHFRRDEQQQQQQNDQDPPQRQHSSQQDQPLHHHHQQQQQQRPTRWQHQHQHHKERHQRRSPSDYVFAHKRDSPAVTLLTRCNAELFRLSRDGDEEGLIRTFIEMKKVLGIQPNQMSYNLIMKFYSLRGELERMMSVFRSMRSNGVRTNVMIYHTLMEAYAQAGDFDRMHFWYNALMQDPRRWTARPVQPSIYIWNTLIRAHGVQRGDIDAMIHWYWIMRRYDEPNHIVCNTMIEAYQNKGDKAGVRWVLANVAVPFGIAIENLTSLDPVHMPYATSLQPKGLPYYKNNNNNNNNNNNKNKKAGKARGRTTTTTTTKTTTREQHAAPYGVVPADELAPTTITEADFGLARDEAAAAANGGNIPTLYSATQAQIREERVEMQLMLEDEWGTINWG